MLFCIEVQVGVVDRFYLAWRSGDFWSVLDAILGDKALACPSQGIRVKLDPILCRCREIWGWFLATKPANMLAFRTINIYINVIFVTTLALFNVKSVKEKMHKVASWSFYCPDTFYISRVTVRVCWGSKPSGDGVKMTATSCIFHRVYRSKSLEGVVSRVSWASAINDILDVNKHSRTLRCYTGGCDHTAVATNHRGIWILAVTHHKISPFIGAVVEVFWLIKVHISDMKCDPVRRLGTLNNPAAILIVCPKVWVTRRGENSFSRSDDPSPTSSGKICFKSFGSNSSICLQAYIHLISWWGKCYRVRKVLSAMFEY